MPSETVNAYEERVKRMSRKQIEATLKSHDGMVGTARWSGLDAGLRADLEAMAAILRKALG